MATEPALLELESVMLQRWARIASSDTRMLLAVSGGADSVSMLRAAVRLTGNTSMLVVGHFNHLWRGSESDRDQAFVSQLAARHGLACRLGRENSSAVGQAQSEESAREQRYRFLEATAYETGARYVLTAHTADDRVETMLHNLFRGTGFVRHALDRNDPSARRGIGSGSTDARLQQTNGASLSRGTPTGLLQRQVQRQRVLSPKFLASSGIALNPPGLR